MNSWLHVVSYMPWLPPPPSLPPLPGAAREGRLPWIARGVHGQRRLPTPAPAGYGQVRYARQGQYAADSVRSERFECSLQVCNRPVSYISYIEHAG